MQPVDLGEDPILVGLAPLTVGLGLKAKPFRDLVLGLRKEVYDRLLDDFELFRGEVFHPRSVSLGHYFYNPAAPGTSVTV